MVDTISVAMATYNGAKYLREQLDSIYSQTLPPNEVIVCDDGSIDETPEILEEYKKKYGLIYYINQTNLGVNKNFEKAIRLCSSEYIAISDQDDVWLPYKLEKSIQKLKQIEGDTFACVSSQAEYVDSNLISIGRPSNIQSDTYGAYGTFFYHVSQGSSLMFNKKLLLALHDFPNNMYYDFYIGNVAASIGNKYNMAEKLMYYRVHGNNVTAKLEHNEASKESLRNKIHKRAVKYKYYNVLSENRIALLGQIQEEYENNLTSEASVLLSVLRSYQTGSFCQRLSAIFSIYKKQPSLAIKKIFIEIIFSCINVDNTIQMF